VEAAGQTPWTGGGSGRTPFSLPKCEAAGSVSRRLRYSSKNQVENRGLVRTSVEAATGGKCRRVNEFAPEVVRHQEFIHPANFRFDSRRLQPSLAVQAKVAHRSLWRRWAVSVTLRATVGKPETFARCSGEPRRSLSEGGLSELLYELRLAGQKPSLAGQAKVAHHSLWRRWAGT